MWLIDVKLKISDGPTHFVSSLQIATEEIKGNKFNTSSTYLLYIGIHFT
jgi:hypothetical protein